MRFDNAVYHLMVEAEALDAKVAVEMKMTVQSPTKLERLHTLAAEYRAAAEHLKALQ